jgi:[acyl-carrier-protein] S-malonyltransferase
MATFSPVKWSESVKRSVSLGASEFVEIGPKKVLCSLVTQTAEHATTQFLSTSSELELFARNIDRRPDANPFAA